MIEVNELQKRRVISKLDQAPRVAGRQADRAARPRLQAEHRRHARGLEPGARGAPAGRGRRASSPTTRSPSGAPSELLPSVELGGSAAEALDGADAAILVTEWPEFAELDWEELGRRMANPLIVDGRNFLDPARLRARRLHLRGDRAAGGGRARLMQAVVLVGGEGTRLRPLTLTQPKPALPLVDRPFIRYMVDWLGRHGDRRGDHGLRLSRRGPARGARRRESRAGPTIRYVEEDEPLGTAGPVRLAADQGLLGERFMVLNGDVLTDLDLTALQRQHAETGAVITLALYPVDDPTSYGLVRRAPTTARCSASSRSPTRPRSTPTRSAPAPTWSSARRST